MAKRKVSNKEKDKETPAQREMVELALELESISESLRTSTVSFTRERILQLAARLKAMGENNHP